MILVWWALIMPVYPGYSITTEQTLLRFETKEQCFAYAAQYMKQPKPENNCFPILKEPK